MAGFVIGFIVGGVVGVILMALVAARKDEKDGDSNGVWEYIQDAGLCQCSICGHLHTAREISVYKYCPNCGSRMVNVEEGYTDADCD